jgi:hypothetical protein
VTLALRGALTSADPVRPPDAANHSAAGTGTGAGTGLVFQALQCVAALSRHRDCVLELGRRGVVPLLCVALHSFMQHEEVRAANHATHIIFYP